MSKINLDKIAHLNPHIKKEDLKVKSTKGDSQKDYLLKEITKFCETNNFTLILEYKFSDRKFRFDYFIKELNLGIEYEGIYSEKSRHTTVSGYTRDTLKYNIACVNNIKVLRYASSTIKNINSDLTQILNNVI